MYTKTDATEMYTKTDATEMYTDTQDTDRGMESQKHRQRLRHRHIGTDRRQQSEIATRK